MKYYAIFIWSLLSCISCGGGGKDFCVILDSASVLMSEYPEQALSVLESIDATEISGRSDRARYALLYTQALDKNRVNIQSDSLIRIAVDYYERKGSEQEKAWAYYYHGCIYANLHDTDMAIETLVKAESYAGKTTDYYLQGLIDSRIGNLYSDEYDHEEALQRFEQAQYCFQKAGASKNEAIALENQGYVHYLTGDYSSARNEWEAAKGLYLDLGERDAAYETDCNLISLRLQNGDDTDAVKKSFRRLCIDYYGEPLPPIAAGIWLDIYKRAGQLDSARMCGQTILANRELFTEQQIAGCYAQLTEIETMARHFERALQYSRLYADSADSLNRISQRTAIKETEQRYDNLLLKESLTTLRLKHRIQSITFVLVSVVSALVAFVIGQVWMRRYKKIRKQQRAMKIEFDELRQVYEDLSGRFEKVKQLLDLSNERESKVGKAIEERLSGLHRLIEKMPTIKPADFIKEFKRYMAVDTSSRYALFDLQYIVNRKYFGIIDHLKARYPDLNKHDLDLCALMCFGFSHTGICYLYDYSDLGSFYNKRSRLRRKLRLPQSCKIEDFIQGKISELRDSSI